MFALTNKTFSDQSLTATNFSWHKASRDTSLCSEGCGPLRLCLCVCWKVPAGDSVDVIPACLLRKYVSYARRYVHPTLSPEAARTLQDFYLSLRVQAQAADCTPITTRQLESLVRLTEVRADQSEERAGSRGLGVWGSPGLGVLGPGLGGLGPGLGQGGFMVPWEYT